MFRIQPILPKILRSILFLLTFSDICLAQVPFAQASQIPILLNSSLAGSKGKNRIVLGWNRYSSTRERESNYTISFDKVSKKLGSGIGICYSFRSNQRDTLNPGIMNILPEGTLKNSFLSHTIMHIVGVCIAPKFNFMNKLNPNIIKYTFSPSLFFEYQHNSFARNSDFNLRAYQSFIYNNIYPNGLALTDSTVIYYHRYATDINTFKMGVSFQVNSSNVILLYRFNYEINLIREHLNQQKFNSSGTNVTLADPKSVNTLFSISQSLNAGITFPMYRKSSFSFTPTAGLGFRTYFNLPRVPEGKPDQVYSRYVENEKELSFNYIHVAANFKLNKMLFGAAYTHSYERNYAGGTLGFQTSYLKLTTTGAIVNIKPLHIFNEVAASILF